MSWKEHRQKKDISENTMQGRTDLKQDTASYDTNDKGKIIPNILRWETSPMTTTTVEIGTAEKDNLSWLR